MRTWQSIVLFFLDCFTYVRNDNKVNSPLTTHNSLVKALAFTLAETLVVMGIIGVVAALTIPNLNQSTGDREKVAKVKKIYANLDDAIGRATAIYGPMNEWGVDDITKISERIIEFMKISKTCGIDTGCFSDKPLIEPDNSSFYKNYVNTLIDNKNYMVITADGTSIGFSIRTIDVDFLQIRVDIDGPNKGKNQIGSDLFDFSYFADYDTNVQQPGVLYPSAMASSWTGDFTPGNAYSYGTAWVIKNGNMDYLKCDDLNWETKTSCK